MTDISNINFTYMTWRCILQLNKECVLLFKIVTVQRKTIGFMRIGYE